MSALRRWLRHFAIRMLYALPVQRILRRVPGSNRLYRGWRRTHPFDRSYKVETSGFLHQEALAAGRETDRYNTGYGGSQPSIIREVLRHLPQPESQIFIDLGCGMGRPLLVASEFPFRAIIGVELSKKLANIAKHNAKRLARRFPERPPITIIHQDVAQYQFPPGNLTLYLYNPFDAPLIEQVSESLNTITGRIFIVYYNPVHGAIFDRNAHLHRFYAATLPCDPSEIAFGPDLEDSVVIWTAGPVALPPLGKADRRIVQTIPGCKAGLV